MIRVIYDVVARIFYPERSSENILVYGLIDGEQRMMMVLNHYFWRLSGVDIVMNDLEFFVFYSRL